MGSDDDDEIDQTDLLWFFGANQCYNYRQSATLLVIGH